MARVKNHVSTRVRVRLTLKQYCNEGRVIIAAGTGAQLLEQALLREAIQRDVVLELPGMPGLGSIIKSTGLIDTLTRDIGETLASVNGIAVHASHFPVDKVAVRQHWHAKYHHEAGNRWLRSVAAELFLSRS